MKKGCFETFLIVERSSLWILDIKHKGFFSLKVPVSCWSYGNVYYIEAGIPKLDPDHEKKFLPGSVQRKYFLSLKKVTIELVFSDFVSSWFITGWPKFLHSNPSVPIDGNVFIFVMSDLKGKKYLIDYQLFGGGINEIDDSTIVKYPLPTYEEMNGALGLQFLTSNNNHIRAYAQLVLKHKVLGTE